MFSSRLEDVNDRSSGKLQSQINYAYIYCNKQEKSRLFIMNYRSSNNKDKLNQFSNRSVHADHIHSRCIFGRA